MTKLEHIELLISDWKAAEDQDKAWGLTDNEQYAKGKKKGLEAALRIFKEPSNTQMQIDKKTCHLNHELLNLEGDNFCKNCGMSFYD